MLSVQINCVAIKGRFGSASPFTGFTLGNLRGFSLVELLVVIAVVGMMAAMLLPALARGKSAARSAACKSNLRQIGVALNLYLEDHLFYPGDVPSTAVALSSDVPEWFGTTGWVARRGLAQMAEHAGAGRIETDTHGQTSFVPKFPSVYYCPGRPKPTRGSGSFIDLSGLTGFPPFGYGYNALGTLWRPPTSRPLGLGPVNVSNSIVRVNAAAVRAPAAMIAVGDTERDFLGNINPYTGAKPTRSLGAFHNSGANAVFCDGHVEYQKFVQWTARTPSARQRWNNDNQPHPETWE